MSFSMVLKGIKLALLDWKPFQSCLTKLFSDWYLLWCFTYCFKKKKKETFNQSISRNRQFIVREFVLYKEGSYIECIWSIIEMIDQVHKKHRFQRLLKGQFVFLFLQSYTTRKSRRLFGKHRSLSSEWCHPFPRLCHVLCTILLRLRWSGTALPRFVADIFSPKGVVNSQDTTDWLQTTTNTAEARRSLN